MPYLVFVIIVTQSCDNCNRQVTGNHGPDTEDLLRSCSVESSMQGHRNIIPHSHALFPVW